jgi:hypothetical protein
MAFDAEWTKSIAVLGALGRVPAAQANAELLRRAQERWSAHVVARTSMHDVWFTRPDDEYPFPRLVRVRGERDGFEFALLDDWVVVTGDHASLANAAAVLDAFLLQLVGEPDRA